jgi:hypothetical protein
MADRRNSGDGSKVRCSRRRVSRAFSGVPSLMADLLVGVR